MASIQTQTLKSGGRSYRLEWRDPSTGKQITKGFKRHGDAVGTRRRSSINSTRGPTRPEPRQGPVAELMDHYLRTAPHAENTAKMTRLWTDRYIVPNLGSKSLLPSRRRSGFLADLRSDEVGEPTIDHVYQTLRAALTVAVEEDRIPVTRQRESPGRRPSGASRSS